MEERTIDPVLRCDSCNKLVQLAVLHKIGVCPLCGNKRMRNVTVLNDVEKKQLETWGMEDFIAEFEVVEVGR